MTLAELRKLFKICRAEGIAELTWDGIHVKFGEKPQSRKSKPAFEEMEREPTDDELAFYSVGGQ